MKSYYRKCRKCRELMPYLSYFLSQEEYIKLPEEDRKLCHNCYIKKYAWDNLEVIGNVY